MLEDGDVVKITVKQTLNAEDVINVFFYVYDLIILGVNLTDVIIDFRDQVWALIRTGQVPEIETTEIIGENVTNGVDINAVSLSIFGLDASGLAVLPSYVAAGYRLNVGDKTTRPGAKRFSGVGEGRVTDNDYDPGSGVQFNIEEILAEAITADHNPVGTALLTPVIVGRDIVGALDLTRISPIISATLAPTIRTQVSRRPKT